MKSMLLLFMFPTIILVMVWVFCYVMGWLTQDSGYDEAGYVVTYGVDIDEVNMTWLSYAPWVVGIVGIWFVIAYFCNVAMIKAATGARTLTRKESPRIYNIVENLCMTCNMDMPKINVIHDPGLNAFASGINKNSYTVTVTTGICEKLDDEELKGVIAHELTHIRNKDTRLLITSIVFVGIISTVLQLIVRFGFRIFLYGGRSRSSKNGGGGAAALIMLVVAVVCTAIAYLFIVLTRFAISRKREYMADAGGAELCGNPMALASALRKISNDPGLTQVEREDVAQLFIHKSKEKKGFFESMAGLFSTHPDIRERIRILEQF